MPTNPDALVELREAVQQFTSNPHRVACVKVVDDYGWCDSAHAALDALLAEAQRQERVRVLREVVEAQQCHCDEIPDAVGEDPYFKVVSCDAHRLLAEAAAGEQPEAEHE